MNEPESIQTLGILSESQIPIDGVALLLPWGCPFCIGRAVEGTG